MRYASLDLGSNTVRLLIAEEKGQGFRALRVERRITRLAGDFCREKGLDGKAMERTLDALVDFSSLLGKEGVKEVFPVATGVLRNAKNAKGFLERVQGRTGFVLRLLGGREEASLMLKGVLSALREKVSPLLVADIGGWSTEVIWVEGELPRKICSLELGAVSLTEKFLRSDPPALEEIQDMEGMAGDVLGKMREELEKEGLQRSMLYPFLVGTAGTMTTLAAIDQKLSVYDPRKITGHEISLPVLEEIYHRLLSAPLRERLKVAGLEKGREDVILGGTAILITLLEVFGLKGLTVVDAGLLEGVLLEGIEKSIGQRA